MHTHTHTEHTEHMIYSCFAIAISDVICVCIDGKRQIECWLDKVGKEKGKGEGEEERRTVYWLFNMNNTYVINACPCPKIIMRQEGRKEGRTAQAGST